MNNVTLVGRLTKDPELRTISTGNTTCSFTVAVSRQFTNANGERETDFINIVAFQKQAENIKKYVTKGSLVAVDGRIQTRNYEDKDGKRVYVTEILANNISFLDSKGTNTSSNDFNSLPEPPREDSVSSSSNMNNMETVSVDKDPFEAFGDSIEISDNDLPF